MAQREHLQMQQSECVVHCSPASLWQHGYQQPLQLSHLLCHPCEGRPIGYTGIFFLWHPVPSVVKTNAVELENLIALKDDATALANNQSVKNPCLQIFFTSQKSDGDPG